MHVCVCVCVSVTNNDNEMKKLYSPFGCSNFIKVLKVLTSTYSWKTKNVFVNVETK